MATKTSTTKTGTSVPLKLLINKESNRVLFAEASKHFVDTLLSFLTLPLGTIARLVQNDSSIGPVTIGGLNSLYKGVADLDVRCFCSYMMKNLLLQPNNSSEDCCTTLKLNIDDTKRTEYYVCARYKYYAHVHGLRPSTDEYNRTCICESNITRPVFLKHCHQGFVNDVATFVITDNLTVIPNGIDNACFGLLQKFGIENPSSVTEMILNVDNEKVLDLLKCSLLSKTTLTDFFLVKKPSPEESRFFLSSVTISGNIKIILKLVIRKSDGKILCAQGEQDFADLLLSFLTFPLGGIARILGENCSLGSIRELYTSVSDLNENKFMSKDAKNRLVEPCVALSLKMKKPMLPILDEGVIEYHRYGDNVFQVKYSKAGEDKSYVENFSKLNLFNEVIHECYVKGPAMYGFTDDLVMAPLSPISALGLINQFETPLNDLKEKVVTIGVKEALSILNAALTSTSALTNGLAHLLTEVKEEK